MPNNPFVRVCAGAQRFSARAPILEEYVHVCKNIGVLEKDPSLYLENVYV